MTRSPQFLALAAPLFVTVGTVLAAPSAAAPIHEDDPKIQDLRPIYPGPGFRRAGNPAIAGLQSSAGVGAGFASQGMRLESWLTLSDLGGATRGNDCWGYVSGSGREYALIGVFGATVVVEVTNPGNAVVVASIPGPGSIWRDIKVYGERAYAVSEGGSGIQVIDLRQVDAGIVTLENTVTGQGSDATHNVAIDEDSGFLYRTGGSGNGLRIYSLANPSNPQFVGSWNSRYVHDAQVVTYTSGPYAGRQIAYCCSGFGNGSVDTGLTILDVTNKGSIFVLGQLAYPNRSYSHQGWLSADRTRFYLGDELDERGGVNTTVTRVFDVSDPGNAFLIGPFDNGVPSVSHNMYERDGFLFQANYTSGIRVFDIAGDPDSPDEIALFDTAPELSAETFNGLWSCYTGLPSGTILGSDIERGLFVWSFEPLRIEVPSAALTALDPNGETVAASISEFSAGSLDASTVRLVVDGGSGPVSMPMTAAGAGDFSAEIPAFPCGTEVTWYITATTTSGIESTFPATAPVTPFVSLVGESVATVRYDNMQMDAGWVGGLPTDTANRGAWLRARPEGTDAEPTDGFPGNGKQCWFTGQAVVANNTDADVDVGFTTLLSPVLDLTGFEYPTIEYYRWYSNVLGQNAQNDVFVVDISNDGGASWQPLEVVGPTGPGTEGGWVRAAFLVPEVIAPTSQMQLRFIASDFAPQNIVEAAIDEFRVFDTACAAPIGTSYCVGEPNSTGSVGAIDGEGSVFLTLNNLELVATNLPPSQTGLFVVAAAQGFLANPGGSQGNLCLGANTGRYLSQVGNSGASGSIRLVVDAQAIPRPMGVGSTLAGDTWNFQCWHRDANPGAASNFTTGYSVTYR